VSRALVAILATLALVAALPAAGIAQDAGSNQYQDPLAGEPGTGGGGGGGGSGGGGGGGGGNGNAPSSGTQGVQNDSGSDTGAAGTSSRDQLPATGSDSWLLALAGVMLLGGGLGLRRVATRPSV
jgi:LPXTG-motif cell wall-anchored protein